MMDAASPQVQAWSSGVEAGFPEQPGDHTGPRPAGCSGRGQGTGTRSLRGAVAVVCITRGVGSFGDIFACVSKLTAAFHSRKNSTPNCPFYVNIILNFSISKVFLEFQPKEKKK